MLRWMTTLLTLLLLVGQAQAGELPDLRAAPASEVDTLVRVVEVPRLPRLMQDAEFSEAAVGSAWDDTYFQGRRQYLLGISMGLVGVTTAFIANSLLGGFGAGIGVVIYLGGMVLAVAGPTKSRRAVEHLTGRYVDNTWVTFGWISAALFFTVIGSVMAFVFGHLQYKRNEKALTDARNAATLYLEPTVGQQLVLRF